MGDSEGAAGGGPTPVAQVVKHLGDIIQICTKSPDILEQLGTLTEGRAELKRENRELRAKLEAAEKNTEVTADRMRAESLELAAKLKESEKNRTANLGELKATIAGLRKKIAELEAELDEKTKRAAYYEQTTAMFQPMASNWQNLQNMLTRTAAPAGYSMPPQQMAAPPPPPTQPPTQPLSDPALLPQSAPNRVQPQHPQSAPVLIPDKITAQVAAAKDPKTTPAKDPYEYAEATDDDCATTLEPEREGSPPLAADNDDPPGPLTAAAVKAAKDKVVINNATAVLKPKAKESAAALKRKQAEPEVDKIFGHGRFTLMTRVSSKSGPKNQRLVSDITSNPEDQYVFDSDGHNGRKPKEKTFGGPSMFITRIRSPKELPLDSRDQGGVGGRLPDPVTWAQNPEICRYLKRLRDLWQGGDIEGPIGRYIESEKASLSDFMTELNEFKSKSWREVFSFFDKVETHSYTGETEPEEETPEEADEGGKTDPKARTKPKTKLAKRPQALSKPANVSPPAAKKQKTYADAAGPTPKA